MTLNIEIPYYKFSGGEMKRILAIVSVIVLMLVLGVMIEPMDTLGVTLMSKNSPAISFGGSDR